MKGATTNFINTIIMFSRLPGQDQTAALVGLVIVVAS